jgi:5'-3' exonuclease
LSKYFPDEFEIDLNGKTLAWEAICLIPFVDEKLFLEAEIKINSELENLGASDKERNKIYFTYKSYSYDQSKKTSGQKSSLKSSLTTFKDLDYDYVS